MQAQAHMSIHRYTPTPTHARKYPDASCIKRSYGNHAEATFPYNKDPLSRQSTRQAQNRISRARLRVLPRARSRHTHIYRRSLNFAYGRKSFNDVIALEPAGIRTMLGSSAAAIARAAESLEFLKGSRARAQCHC